MAQLVTAPQRRPRQGGIKSIVESFINEPRLGGPAAGAFVWEDWGCITEASPTRAACYDATIDPALDEDKTATGYDESSIIGDPFARYVGKQCFIGGDSDGPDYAAQAATNLEAIEDREVEAVLWAWAAAAATPGTAATVAAAIGAADEYADTNYVGQPVLVMSRATADAGFAAGALARVDGNLVTGNGTPVLATGVVPDAEEDTIVAIGWPVVFASPVVSRTAVHHTSNVELAIAERIYAVGVDCDFRHAVTVTTP